jgi:hypothetical protein
MVLHRCEGDLDGDGWYGPAINECWSTLDGTMWAGNIEYTSQVNFCPYCGYEALTRVGAEPSRRVEAGVGNAVDNP